MVRAKALIISTSRAENPGYFAMWQSFNLSLKSSVWRPIAALKSWKQPKKIVGGSRPILECQIVANLKLQSRPPKTHRNLALRSFNGPIKMGKHTQFQSLILTMSYLQSGRAAAAAAVVLFSKLNFSDDKPPSSKFIGCLLLKYLHKNFVHIC